MRDVSAFSHSEQVELATTDEMLDMFSTYVETDVADARNRGSRIIKENIDIELDFNARCWMPTMLLYQLQASLPRPKEITSALLTLRSLNTNLCTLAEQCICVLALLWISQIDC